MADLMVPSEVMAVTTSAELQDDRDRAKNWRAEHVRLRPSEVTDVTVEDLITASEKAGDGSFARVMNAIKAARAGEIKNIPSFRAAPALLTAYLQTDMIDGWIYKRGTDGHMHPRLVTSISIVEARGIGDEPTISIRMTSDFPFAEGRSRDQGAVSDSITLAKGAVAKKSPADVFLNAGYVRETPELKAAYLERFARFTELMANGFAQQYKFTGVPATNSYRDQNPRQNRKVVMDVKPSELTPLRGDYPSELAELPDGDKGLLAVPVETVTRVFDLNAHEFWTVNVNDLTDYEYDLSLRDKLILPDDQRELLDVLTTDLGAFTADMIEGKSAGNVVLAKGSPGVGKTLTAEVYAELVERPLYSIHSGVLGTTAGDVRKHLEEAFDRAQRWNAVMLLDEADVFVLARGNDIAQNAICAEFLRTLEYFDGLLFMTTNRSDDIDDAIISRCAALIDYKVPDAHDARKIWNVLATQMKTVLPEALVDELIVGLPDISPRDMKMLLRLTLRMAASKGEPATAAVFARCATFRGLHFKTGAAA